MSTTEIEQEIQDNLEKVRKFSEQYLGRIYSVGVGPRQVFAGVNYLVMVAQVWEPMSNAMVTLEVCDNKRSSWARDPQPLPIASLTSDLPDAIRKSLHDAEEREDKARELEEEFRVKAAPAKGKFAHVHSGSNAGSFGKVFWANGSRCGITTTMEKEGERYKEKDIIWCQNSEVTVLLQTTPKKGSKDLVQLFRYAPILVKYRDRFPNFEAMWGKVRSQPVPLALLHAYTDAEIPPSYGGIWTLVRRVEEDTFLKQQLTLAVEKSDPAHFNAPWFPVSLRAMVEATFPPGEVTAA